MKRYYHPETGDVFERPDEDDKFAPPLGYKLYGRMTSDNWDQFRRAREQRRLGPYEMPKFKGSAAEGRYLVDAELAQNEELIDPKGSNEKTTVAGSCAIKNETGMTLNVREVGIDYDGTVTLTIGCDQSGKANDPKGGDEGTMLADSCVKDTVAEAREFVRRALRPCELRRRIRILQKRIKRDPAKLERLQRQLNEIEGETFMRAVLESRRAVADWEARHYAILTGIGEPSKPSLTRADILAGKADGVIDRILATWDRPTDAARRILADFIDPEGVNDAKAD